MKLNNTFLCTSSEKYKTVAVFIITTIYFSEAHSLECLRICKNYTYKNKIINVISIQFKKKIIYFHFSYFTCTVIHQIYGCTLLVFIIITQFLEWKFIIIDLIRNEIKQIKSV